jgi:dTDP-4-dehydrorhamnose reductase
LRVFVTGCNGLLGVDLVAAFRSRGHEVGGCDLPQVDVTRPREVAAAVEEAGANVVVHAAAMTDVDGCERDPVGAFTTNALGTRNVAVACQSAGAPMIYLSTDFVFDGTGDRPYREFDPPNPLCVYGRSKLEGEQYVRHLVPRHMVVRTAWLYGARGRNFVRSILSAATRDEPVRVVTDQVGSPTYTRDLASAIVRLVETRLWGVYHVTNSGAVSWWGFGHEILRLVGLGDRTITPISSVELDRAAGRPSYSVLDTSSLEATIGERLRNWRAALEDFLSGEGKALLQSGGAV